MDNCNCKDPISGCLICGKPLVYSRAGKNRTCAVCGRVFWSHEECEDGHFVCNDCHAGSGNSVLSFIKTTREKSPAAIMEQVWQMPEVHLFGPEHHRIVPCVLLAAYRNCGGEIGADDIDAAWKRGEAVIGGTCGYWGVCGAAIGMGIFFSVLYAATPMSRESWALIQRFSAICLERISQYGGPRCCKRTCRIAINTAAELVAETSLIHMPTDWKPCGYSALNRECLRSDCPFYGGNR